MARQLGSSKASGRRSGKSSPSVTDVADDLAVRAYLRAVIGSPVRSSDTTDTTEMSFVGAVSRWSEQTGADRKTLLSVGVDRRILDAAGLKNKPVADLVRKHYGGEPFSVSGLARRSGVSPTSVRQTIYEDELHGIVEEVESSGKALLFRLVD